jgi:hypothetical protein
VRQDSGRKKREVDRGNVSGDVNDEFGVARSRQCMKWREVTRKMWRVQNE